MALQYIPVGQYDSFKPAIEMAKTKAIESRVLHAVRRNPQGGFEVCRSSKGRLGEFQKFITSGGYSLSSYSPVLLRESCLNLGLSPSGWRFLHWHGDSAYNAIVRSYPYEDGLLEALIRYVEWQVRARLESPLPILLGQICNQVFEAGFESLASCSSRLALEASKHWQTLHEVSSKEEFLTTQWRPVLEWMREDRPRLNANQWRSGWRAIFRAFQKTNRARSKQGHWQSRLGPFSTPNFVVIPLVRSDQVRQEGEAMDHCVADYIELCQLGEYRLFSIREHGSRERVATVGLEFDGERWCLDQAKGLSNQNPSCEVLTLSSELANRYELVCCHK